MHNIQRGVKTTEQNCKVGKVTKIEVELDNSFDEAFSNPIAQLKRFFENDINPTK